MERRTLLFAIPALAFASFAVTPAHAAKASVYQTLFGTAIDGTDPVSYFTQGRPVEGRSDITYEWKGATWRFSSEENKARFVAAPEKYAPQFGGYCAWAVAQGYTASTVPDAWAIVDGKLYLNYSKSVQKRWEQDVPGNITSANGNWPNVLN